MECFQQGYRIFRLYNKYGQLVEHGLANLLLHITTELSDDYLTEKEMNSMKKKLETYSSQVSRLENNVLRQQNKIYQLKKMLDEKEKENKKLREQLEKYEKEEKK